MYDNEYALGYGIIIGQYRWYRFDVLWDRIGQDQLLGCISISYSGCNNEDNHHRCNRDDRIRSDKMRSGQQYRSDCHSKA